MTTLLLIVRILLACDFAVAGVAKLSDRSGSRQAIVDFGLPSSLAGPLGLLLPLAELATAGSTDTHLLGSIKKEAISSCEYVRY
jgi:uncharacterized membrane protein YphA (DoxX/SURF4 family)